MSLQSWSNERYTCSGLPLMVSWWVQYQAKCPRPDFNSGPEDNLNSATFWPPAFIRLLFDLWPVARPFHSWNAEGCHSLHYHRPVDFTIFQLKCSETSFEVNRQQPRSARLRPIQKIPTPIKLLISPLQI